MDRRENQYLYLYDTLTLIGTSRKMNLIFWNEVNFSCLDSWTDMGPGPAVINFVAPEEAKIVIFIGDKLVFPLCTYYWNGLPLIAGEKERIILITDDGIYTLAEIMQS